MIDPNAAIFFSVGHGVDRDAYADAVAGFESAGLPVLVEQRDQEFFASLQFLIPTAIAVYVLKPYTDKFLGKLAEDNYESCKAGLKFLWARFAAKDRKLRSVLIASSEGKVTDRTLSADISFLAKTADGQAFRLSFPQNASEEEFQNAVHRFYGLMVRHDLAPESSPLKARTSLEGRAAGQRILTAVEGSGPLVEVDVLASARSKTLVIIEIAGQEPPASSAAIPKLKFETERTRRFRAGELSETDSGTISNVEEFGCSVIQVKSSKAGPGWSYTLGVYDTCGKPEIVTVGLREKTALALLNEAAEGLREGVDLTQGRHREMLGEVECEFRPVDPKWTRHLMGWALWYYDGAEFPVLQAVYPDLENRFPGEDGFDTAFQQPLMQPGAPMTSVEEDFWASADPKSSLFDWKFPDPPHTSVYLSETVHTGKEPVTYVSHDAEDGAWQFLGDSMADGGGPVISCFHHPIDNDPSLNELADLPVGWYAERSTAGEPWVRNQHEA